MEIFPVWRDLFFEYQGDVLEYRITIKDGDEIFHGRAVKSPKDRVIRIRLNDCCESFLNSLLTEEAFYNAEEADRAYPMDAYGEFALDVIDGDSWETAYEWAFTNDYSYDYKEPQGSYSEPINGHSATGQLLPYSHLVTGDTESVCYDGCGGVFFDITLGAVVEYGWGGGYWAIRWDTNLDSVYYVCSDGTTGTSSNGYLSKTLPRNYNHFKQQYTVRFYDRQGGTLLGTAVATVDAVPNADPDPAARTMSIISYPSVITNETTAVTVEYSISDREEVFFYLYSSTTQGSGYQEYNAYSVSRNAGVNTETFTFPANTEAEPVYYRISLGIIGLNRQFADITQLGTHPEELYLTINAIDDIGLVFHRSQSASTMQNLEYSTDKGVTWGTLPTSVDTAQSTTFLAGTKVWLRGNGALEENWLRKYSFYGTTGRFNVYGNVMSLIYGDDFIGRTDATVDWGFNKLFQQTDVVSARQLVLPSLSVGEYAYEEMFWDCSYLTAAPELPATTLGPSCYVGMFRGCSSLTTAPALPATALTERCYFQMFGGCSFTTPPELPATTLAKLCYSEMFAGCTSLVSAPELPATTLVESCYSNMFHGCTSLAAAPVLPATTMAKDCYNGMFNGCTSLTTAPSLPSTELAMECYAYMFYGCTSLTTAPALPATALTSYCYTQMFLNCTSLAAAPELPAETLRDYSYAEMFSGCTSLNYIKCLARDISRTNCTRNWVKGVASTGTFVKDPNAYYWTTGVNGIPDNWTIEWNT